MSKAATSVVAFGIYALIAGSGFLLVPNVILSLVGEPTTGEPWIRVLGAVAVALGYYYVAAGRAELVPFFRASIVGRAFFALATLALVITGFGPTILIVFGGVDLLGAAWTKLALRAS